MQQRVFSGQQILHEVVTALISGDGAPVSVEVWVLELDAA
jgi:hypothetical protein